MAYWWSLKRATLFNFPVSLRGYRIKLHLTSIWLDHTVQATIQELLDQVFPRAHSLITKVCLTHLAEHGFQDTAITTRTALLQALRADPLLAYAYDAWAFHVQNSIDSNSTTAQIKAFIENTRSFPVIIPHQLSPSLDEDFDLLGSLHVVAFYDLPVVLAAEEEIQMPNVRTPLRRMAPLNLASYLGNPLAVQSLSILPNLAINGSGSEGYTALILASRSNHEHIVALLLAHPAIDVNLPDVDGHNPLILASRKGYSGIVQLLLAHRDIDPNLADPGGTTALMFASMFGYESVVERLLAHPGVQINLKGLDDGATALILASMHGCEGIVKLLLAHPDVAVNQVDDDDGATALVHASRYSQYEDTVKLLLGHPEVEVNLADSDDGATPLMLASSYGWESVVKLLLARPDIEVDTADDNGATALMHASGNGHERIVELLRAHSAAQVS